MEKASPAVPDRTLTSIINLFDEFSLSIFISVKLMYMLKSSLIHHSGGSGVGNTDSFINHNVNGEGTRARSGGVVGLD